MPKSVSFRIGIVSLVLLYCMGCSKTAEDDVLAKIGTKEITVEDLRRFKTETPALLRSEKEGIEEVRDYLQTMMDMELMLLEAREQGIGQDPEFLRRWEKTRREKLVAAFVQRKIRGEISPEELQRRFDESKWNRVVKLAHIRVETEEDTRKVVRALEQGRPFDEVAGVWSIDRTTAPKGGLLEPFYGRLNLRELGVTPSIGEELLELQVGECSRPFQIADGYEIFKVVEERPAPPHYSGIFTRQTLKTELYNRRKELMADLSAEFEARLDQAGIAHLIETASRPSGNVLELSAQEQQIILCRFKGGQLTLKDFVDTYQQVRAFRRVTFDSSGIAEFINRILLPDALMVRVALREGFEQEESVAAWLAAKKEAMLVEALREREVEKRIVTDDQAVRDYYETHLDRFMQLEETRMLEILVETREEAEGLLQRIRNGEDMETLAERYSIRRGAKSKRGRFHMHPYEVRAAFGGEHLNLDEVMEAEVGDLRGPVQVKEGVSIFKITERIPPKPEPFEEAASRAEYWLRRQEEDRLFEALLLKLREKYASKVVLFEDRLKIWVADK